MRKGLELSIKLGSSLDPFPSHSGSPAFYWDGSVPPLLIWGWNDSINFAFGKILNVPRNRKAQNFCVNPFLHQPKTPFSQTLFSPQIRTFLTTELSPIVSILLQFSWFGMHVIPEFSLPCPCLLFIKFYAILANKKTTRILCPAVLVVDDEDGNYEPSVPALCDTQAPAHEEELDFSERRVLKPVVVLLASSSSFFVPTTMCLGDGSLKNFLGKWLFYSITYGRRICEGMPGSNWGISIDAVTDASSHKTPKRGPFLRFLVTGSRPLD